MINFEQKCCSNKLVNNTDVNEKIQILCTLMKFSLTKFANFVCLNNEYKMRSVVCVLNFFYQGQVRITQKERDKIVYYFLASTCKITLRTKGLKRIKKGGLFLLIYKIKPNKEVKIEK